MKGSDLDREIKLFPFRELLSWYKKNSRKLPWREHISPYKIWISEIMLQQTRVENVIPYFDRFIKKFPDIQTLSQTRKPEVLRLWSGLGYYSRARNILKTAKIISQEHDGKFPKDLNSLVRLPGIGNYTAGAILSIAYNLPFPILDGNVRRVLSRVYMNLSEKQLWKIAEELVLGAGTLGIRAGDFNQALMELGALVCFSRNPLCSYCPLQLLCLAKQKKMQSFFPSVAKKQKTISKVLAVAILKKEKQLPRKILLRRRNEKSRWLQGLWELPVVELKENNTHLTNEQEQNLQMKTLSKVFSKELAGKVKLENYLGFFAHSITYHRFKVHLFEGELRNFYLPNSDYRWIVPTAGRTIPSSSLLKKSLALWKTS